MSASRSRPAVPTARANRRGRKLLIGGFIGLLLWGGLRWGLHAGCVRQLAARDYDRAETCLAWLNRFPPRSADSLFLEARLHRKRHETVEATKLLELAGERGVDRRRILGELLLIQAQAGDLTSIAGELNRWLLNPGDDGAEICEAYVNGALIAGDPAVALTILSAWKTEYPRDPQPYYAEGRRYDHLGQTAEAEQALRAALERQPRHWPARYALGRMLLDLNRADEAREAFEGALPMRENAAPRYGRARCLRIQGRLDEAVAELEGLTQVPQERILISFQRVGEPERGRPIELELGMLLSERQRYAEALPWLELVLRHDRRQLEARYARAVALRAAGQTEAADAELREVQRIRGLVAEADRLVDEVRRNPEDPQLEARLRIGEIFITESHGVRGEFWLREVLRREPRHRRAHQLLADYYAELSEAEPEYREAAARHRAIAEEGATP